MSSMCSVSIDRRMVDGLMCWASSSSGDNCEWVVVENLLIFAFYTLFFISVFNSKRCHLFADAEFLLSNAEVGEDVAEEVVGADFAGDFAEVVHGLTDVLRYEVAWQVDV